MLALCDSSLLHASQQPLSVLYSSSWSKGLSGKVASRPSDVGVQACCHPYGQSHPSNQGRHQLHSLRRFLITIRVYDRVIDVCMLGTPPDIAFAGLVFSSYASNPNKSHWSAVKCIFRHLKGTLNLQLTCREERLPLAEYTNAD